MYALKPLLRSCAIKALTLVALLKLPSCKVKPLFKLSRLAALAFGVSALGFSVLATVGALVSAFLAGSVFTVALGGSF